MKEWLDKLLQLLGLLQPRQHNSGTHAVQVEQAGRDVRVHHAPVTHVHLVQNIYQAPQPNANPLRTAAAPLRAPPAPAAPLLGLVLNPKVQQREALQLMDALTMARRVAVLAFMRREFGTDRVKQLDATQCVRLRRYVEEVLKNVRAANE